MTHRYTVDTDIRPAMQAQGFTCCVLDTETEGLKSITTAKAYCFFQEDAERIAEALNAADASATYTPGIGWQAVTPTGRYGSFETQAQALAFKPEA